MTPTQIELAMTDNLGGYTRAAQAKRLMDFGETDPTARSPLSNGHIAEIVRYQAQRIAELEAQLTDSEDRKEMLMMSETTVREQKRHLDAISEALGQPKLHKSERTEMGLEDDLPPYQPDQLAGMVRELREKLEWQGEITRALMMESQERLAREGAALRAAIDKAYGVGAAETLLRAARANSGDAHEK